MTEQNSVLNNPTGKGLLADMAVRKQELGVGDAANAAPAASVDNMPPVDGGKVSKKVSKADDDAFKKKGQELRANYTEAQKAEEGSKSDTVEFLCTLGDPRFSPKTNDAKLQGTCSVIGYKVRILEDMQVPVMPFLREGRKDTSQFENISFVDVKAGSEVILNIAEAGYLISQTRFGGIWTGGDTAVKLTATANKNLPPTDRRPVLDLVSPTGTIKAGQIKIATLVGKDEKGRKIWEVGEEYKEKFQVLFDKKAPVEKTQKAKNEAAKDYAAAFLNFYQQKLNSQA